MTNMVKYPPWLIALDLGIFQNNERILFGKQAV